MLGLFPSVSICLVFQAHSYSNARDLFWKSDPKDEAFAPRTSWSLSNAFTSALKALKSVSQFQQTAWLGSSLSSPSLHKYSVPAFIANRDLDSLSIFLDSTHHRRDVMSARINLQPSDRSQDSIDTYYAIWS